MNPNTGGPAFPIHGNGMFGEPVTLKQGMTLLDWMAGQALAGYVAHNGVSGNFDEHANQCYDLASAMLTEKARREAGHSETKLGNDQTESKIIRAGWDLFTWADKTMEETDECRVFLHNWKEAVVQESSTTDHFCDATKMIPGGFAEATLRRLAHDVLHADIKDAAKDQPLIWCAEQVRARVNTLEALNRELVESLEVIVSITDRDHAARDKARAVLAKAKGVA